MSPHQIECLRGAVQSAKTDGWVLCNDLYPLGVLPSEVLWRNLPNRVSWIRGFELREFEGRQRSFVRVDLDAMLEAVGRRWNVAPVDLLLMLEED